MPVNGFLETQVTQQINRADQSPQAKGSIGTKLMFMKSYIDSLHSTAWQEILPKNLAFQS